MEIIQIGNYIPQAKYKNCHRGRVYSPMGVSPTLNTNGGGNLETKMLICIRINDIKQEDMIKEINGVKYEFVVKKLSPRESFRLMGLDEKSIDKIQQTGISKTQQYKMAGNSIVVNVLYHLFRKMFVDNVPPQRTQMTLF